MVTVTPHLSHAVGVLLITDDVHKGVFVQLLEAETAVPARRAGVFAVGKEGGDVLVKVCEGIREVRVRKMEHGAEHKKATNGAGGEVDEEDGELDDDDDDSDNETEEVREKVWRVGRVLAEAAVRHVGKGAKVEVTVNVGGDLGVQVTAREVGAKGGVRGVLEAKKGGG